ncbi:hypothetical protein SpCBS45565_g07873 [Spizellomyces sp. 'palustris']|nr:hypothetical protein SpCBS45565_g07873 [Spizellomyces sp. 'palustris']
MAAGWSIEEITKFYGSYAKSYDEDIEKETYPAPFIIANWVLEHFSNMAPHQDRLAFLDLGCGTGQSSKLFFTQPLSQRIDVYGVDATPEMLDKAKQFPFRELLCQDIEADIPFARVFDAINFVKNPQKLFTTVARSLKENGQGCFAVTLPESGGLNTFAEADILKLVNGAGFKIKKNDRFFGYEDSETKVTVHYQGLLLTL